MSDTIHRRSFGLLWNAYFLKRLAVEGNYHQAQR